MSLTPTLLQQYDRAAPKREDTETATVALGCFWGPDAKFGAMDGVVRTRVGYAGGTTPEPTYADIGDHTEALQIGYDPERLSFADVLDVAFRSHDPRHQVRKTQYQNIVFTATAEQRDALSSYLDDSEYDREGIETRIEPLEGFTLAEPYHQKYHLQSKRWATTVFREAGYDGADLRESPAAATLNGYVAGHDIPDAEQLGVGSSDSPEVDGLQG